MFCVSKKEFVLQSLSFETGDTYLEYVFDVKDTYARSDIPNAYTDEKLNVFKWNANENETIDILKEYLNYENVETLREIISIYVADDGFYHVAIMYNWSQEVEILEEDYVKSYAEWRNGGNHSSEKILENVTYALDFYNTFLSDMGENVTKIDGAYYYQVPKDCYFCLGDNRAYSNDSRSRGVFKKSQIKGVAEIIIKGGSLESGSLASKKFNAIISYYWKRLEKSFMR